MRKAALLLLAAATLSSCHDKNDDPIPVGKNLYPAKIVEKDEDGKISKETTYEYDRQNHLVKSIATEYDEKGVNVYTSNYTYNSNDQLSEIIVDEQENGIARHHKKVLGYTNGLLSAISKYSGSDTQRYSYDTLFYNGNNLPYMIKTDQGRETRTFTYDLTGNAKYVNFSYDNWTTETTITYDTDHRFPLCCLPTLAEDYLSMRNCPTLSKSIMKNNGVTIFKGTTVFNYTFNSDGFPIKVVTTTNIDDQTPDNDDISMNGTVEITYK